MTSLGRFRLAIDEFHPRKRQFVVGERVLQELTLSDEAAVTGSVHLVLHQQTIVRRVRGSKRAGRVVHPPLSTEPRI